MPGKKVFRLSPDVTKPVDDMVEAQNSKALELGVPKYGFPSYLLYDIPSIFAAAKEKAGSVAKMVKANDYSWGLYYKVGSGVYGEISWKD